MSKYCGMNFLEYLEYLISEYGMSEADAEAQASCDFGLMEDDMEVVLV